MRFTLLVWLVLLYTLSITPLSFKLKVHTIGQLHDVGHYVVYTVTGLMLWLAAEKWLTRTLAFAFGVAVLLGQEWIENKLYHAGFEWRDVKTDLAGLATGLAVMVLFSALMSDAGSDRSRARF
jgi:hypothetical protein